MVAPCLSWESASFAMRMSPVRSRSRPPNYFALRKPDAPSGFRRYETERVGLYSCEFRKAWDSRAVGRRFHSDFSLDSTSTITALIRIWLPTNHSSDNPWSAIVDESLTARPGRTFEGLFIERESYCKYLRLRLAIRALRRLKPPLPSLYYYSLYLVGACLRRVHVLNVGRAPILVYENLQDERAVTIAVCSFLTGDRNRTPETLWLSNACRIAPIAFAFLRFGFQAGRQQSHNLIRQWKYCKENHRPRFRLADASKIDPNAARCF